MRIVSTPHYHADLDTSHLVQITLDAAATDASDANWPTEFSRTPRDNDSVLYFEDPPQATHNSWMKKLGRAMMEKVIKPHVQSGPGTLPRSIDSSMLHGFPTHYRLYCKRTGNRRDPRRDYYLCGWSKDFRSPEEFAPHLHWLMLGRPTKPDGQTACGCQYCSHRSQKTITREYFTHAQGAGGAGQGGRGRGRLLRSGARAPPPARQEPVGPIVAKDYTKLRPDQIAK